MDLSEGIEALTLVRPDGHGATCCTATLRRNGSIVWTGETSCESPGLHAGRFDAGQFKELARFVARAGAFDGNPPGEMAFDSGYQLTVHTVDGDRTTRSESWERNEFWVIATLIDHLADQAGWNPHG